MSMGVYIKGMEMPYTCLSCDFHKCAAGVGDYCTLTKKKQFRFKNRPSYCPLVPVPEHGRLGDLDALIEKVIAKYLEHERKGELVFAAAEIKQDIVDLISDAPTIIEAEEGE